MLTNNPGPNDGPAAASTQAGTPLYPPAITPPEAPLPLLKFLRQFPKNPLRSVPRGAYEQDIFVLRAKTLNVAYAWITGPELIEEILIRRAGALNKSRVEKQVFDRSVGDSVLTADGARWRWQRRVLAPLFRHQEIIAYVPRMSQAAEQHIAVWQASGPGLRNVEEDMTQATLAVIMRSMLGNSDAGVATRIMAATEAYLSKASWEAAYAIIRMPNWVPHPGTWRMIRSARTLRSIMADLIAERRAIGGADDDLLGRLLAARDPETDEPMHEKGLINNVSTLLLAGHETTAKALTWTLYLLARAPEWQRAVREEVARVAGGNRIGAEHIDQLQITKRILKESMRLYPPAPVVARVNTEFIRAGDENLPVGSNLVFPVYAIHRHRKYWQDPDRFDPDRFLPENEKRIPRTQYMPFGAGPRICIGQAFAMIEAVTLLASFIRAAEFDWDGKHKPEPISRITLRPAGGMPLLVRPL